MLSVDCVSDTVEVLVPRLRDGVDENDAASVEGCRSIGRLETRLNNLENVSTGCTVAASWFSPFKLPPSISADVLTGAIPLAACESSDIAIVDEIDGRVAVVDRT